MRSRNWSKWLKSLDKTAWKQLQRQQRISEIPRARRPNSKEQAVVEKEYMNKRLEKEFVAEFEYSRNACDQTYRMIVLHKQVSVTKGQRKLIDDSPFFFYITNVSSAEKFAEEIVLAAKKRCDQENIISQGKQIGAFAAPLTHTHLLSTLRENLIAKPTSVRPTDASDNLICKASNRRQTA